MLKDLMLKSAEWPIVNKWCPGIINKQKSE